MTYDAVAGPSPRRGAPGKLISREGFGQQERPVFKSAVGNGSVQECFDDDGVDMDDIVVCACGGTCYLRYPQ